jgi:hypothetical protein
MGVELLLGLLGGLALFLYGMQMMSNNLEAAAGDSFCQYLVSHCQRQLADWLYILFNHMVRLIRKPLHSVFRDFLILRVYHKKYQCDGLLHRRLCPRQCKPPR